MSGAEPLGVRSERTRNPKSEINLVQELNQRPPEEGIGGVGHEARVSLRRQGPLSWGKNRLANTLTPSHLYTAESLQHLSPNGDSKAHF